MERFLHPSSHAAAPGRTIGTPRLYELFTGLFWAGGRTRAYRQLVCEAGIGAGDLVLDVGCGDGLLTSLAAAAAGAEGSALGIDASPEMIAYASRRRPAARFEVASATAIPSPSEQFDAVVSSLVLHHLPFYSVAEALSEMTRVLKPGGRLLLAEFRVPAGGPLRLVAHLAGMEHMAERVPAPEGLLAEAGATGITAGTASPWLRYAVGRRPAAGALRALSHGPGSPSI